MTTFGMLTLAGWALAVVVALVFRSRVFGVLVGVMLGAYSLFASAVLPRFGVLQPIGWVLHATVYVNFLALSRPRMRPPPYRWVISWPSSFFAAGTLLAFPWGIAFAFGLHPWGLAVPYALAAVGIAQSLRTKPEVVHIEIGGAHTASEKVLPHPPGTAREARPLRIAQISDPHLGPFMSVDRLRRIAERAVAAQPDLVLLTGDFLTMESQREPEHLLRAFEPLRAMQGRVFACHGNHDHEAPTIVAEALAANGIQLLIDASADIVTEGGSVQIVGVDFTYRNRREHLARVCAAHPRKEGATRLVLLHDPGAFKHLPDGHADLCLAGHTHGGQLGLLSLGLSWTVLRLFGYAVPDHGLWARGRDRLYVHRGTGHYGFPLRLGVPAEESVLHVHRT
jgi:predicted MPP superfamily phosphohydrolase